MQNPTRTIISLHLAGLALAAACSGSNGDPASAATSGGPAGATSGGSTGSSISCADLKLSDCGGVCADTQRDPDHCGGCGKKCNGGSSCSEGSCTSNCDKLAQCGSSCADLKVDAKHCGECNKACADGEYCKEGKCAVWCGSPDLSFCNGKCIDTASNPKSCGSCDKSCLGSQICSKGTCCSAEKVNCSSSCVDVKKDTKNCGECGKACATGEVCGDGKCRKPATCLEVLGANPSAASGGYVLDPDGLGPEASFDVYCDMTSDGGGFTLVARAVNNSKSKYANKPWIATSEWWCSRTTASGSTTDPSACDDMISEAFWKIAGKEMRVTAGKDKTHAHVMMSTGGCLDGQTMRKLISGMAGSGCDDKPWQANTTALECNAVYAKNAVAVPGFMYTGGVYCTTPFLGGVDKVSFFARYNNTGAVVMFGGGGGDACGKAADHGIGLFAKGEKFGAPDPYDHNDVGNIGKGDLPDDCSNGTGALNLWVR